MSHRLNTTWRSRETGQLTPSISNQQDAKHRLGVHRCGWQKSDVWAWWSLRGNLGELWWWTIGPPAANVFPSVLTILPLVQVQRCATWSKIPGEHLKRSSQCAPLLHKRVPSAPWIPSRSNNNQQQLRGASETLYSETWERGARVCINNNKKWRKLPKKR